MIDEQKDVEKLKDSSLKTLIFSNKKNMFLYHDKIKAKLKKNIYFTLLNLEIFKKIFVLSKLNTYGLDSSSNLSMYLDCAV